MISREEKLRLKMLITDTVLLLCKNGLVPKLKGEFSIEGLIGISLQDEEDLMLVSFKESLKGNIESDPDLKNADSETDSELDHQTTESKRHKRRKRKHKKQADVCDEDVSPAKSASLDRIDPESQTVYDNHSATSFPSPNIHKSSDSQETIIVRKNESETLSTREESMADDLHDHITIELGNEDTGQSNCPVKLERYDKHSDDELILIKQELAHPPASSVTSHLEVGPFVSGTQITGILPNQSSFSNSDTTPTHLNSATLASENQLPQVELLPGSGVYISQLAYQQLQYIDKGTKLVRKLVREVFPDVHVLANSSCKGRGTSGGLDQHKVEVIKEFVMQQYPSLTEAVLLDTMNHVCIESRRLIRARAARSKKSDPCSQDIGEIYNLYS